MLWMRKSTLGHCAIKKKYDPGAQCGIEYYIMYFKFARMPKYEFLIFDIFVVQDKKYLYVF